MLTSAQQTALAADIAANNATIGGTAIKNLAHSADNAVSIADWYSNQFPGTDYWVWATKVSRSQVYGSTSDTGSTWNWATYKAQTVTEQGSWTQMFMGDACNFSLLNNRAGVQAIFGGAAPGNTQRDHVFAVARRKASNVEKLFATAVASPPANTGNDGVAGNRGKTTNPDVMGYEGIVTDNDIRTLWGI